MGTKTVTAPHSSAWVGKTGVAGSEPSRHGPGMLPPLLQAWDPTPDVRPSDRRLRHFLGKNPRLLEGATLRALLGLTSPCPAPPLSTSSLPLPTSP